MAKAKKENLFEGYIRVRDTDKDQLSKLVMKGKGVGRTLNEYADVCGVNVSTLSRIVNKKNSGPSADRLIAKLALHADSSSGVTIEQLLEAHGLAPVEGQSTSPREVLMRVAKEDYQPTEVKALESEMLLDKSREALLEREAVQNSLLNMGYGISLDKNQTAIRGVEFDCYASFVLLTDALKEEGLDRWAFIRARELGNQAAYGVNNYFGMMFINNPVKDRTRVSLVTEDKPTYFMMRDMFFSAKIPASFSFILIDTGEKKVVHEFVIGRNDGIDPVCLFDKGGPTDYQELFGFPEEEDMMAKIESEADGK